MRQFGYSLVLLFVQQCLLFSQDNSAQLKAYNNYDFIPGSTIIFEDDFTDTQDGEFPAHWKLESGQAVVNNINGESVCFITDGSYGILSPRLKETDYLPEIYTLEYDFKFQANTPLIIVNNGEDDVFHINIDMGRILLSGQNTELIGSLPPDLTEAPEFLESWHHLAVIFKHKQVKIYIDQFRILVVPEVAYVPKHVSVAASANPQETAVFKNFKLAKGGEMNDILHLMTEGKYISYGIRFDINKSTIKPESMGAANEIIKVLKSNPVLKFEVGGHTDADGDESANLILSQKRAESVVSLIISMGIESGRLTAKGYGESRPVADNSTFDGRAKNRRVEFLKK